MKIRRSSSELSIKIFRVTHCGKQEDRPIAIDGQVVIRPMMYLALSYDHRIIDGSTSVTFLVKVKELLEDPLTLMMDI